MRLEEEIYNKIKKICDEADKHVLICEFNKAMEKYNKALELFPDDIEEYEESTMIYTAIGDAYCLAGEYERAKNYFYDALDYPNGIANPYILFRLGECLYECDEKHKSQEYFIKAYMMDGLNLFEKNDKKIFRIYKKNYKLIVYFRRNNKMFTNKEIEKEIFDILDECEELEFENNIEDAIKKLKDGWNTLPNPKIQQPMSYLLLEKFFDLCIKNKKFELANKWISLIFISDLIRVDDGDREFIAGKLAYEQGELEVAKELFVIANVKSEGELFKGKDKKVYRDIIK